MTVGRIFTKIYIFISLSWVFSKTGKTRVSYRVKMMTRWPGLERWPKWPSSMSAVQRVKRKPSVWSLSAMPSACTVDDIYTVTHQVQHWRGLRSIRSHCSRADKLVACGLHTACIRLTRSNYAELSLDDGSRITETCVVGLCKQSVTA